MQFAIVNDQRVRPSRGLQGACPCCGAAVIAKCGQFKVHHWSHRSLKNCDPWWENETEWHRNWKNHFDAVCHEVVLFDPLTKEKHIADIQTAAGTIVEFQHSAITEQERISRESFYLTFSRHLIWVLDCTDETHWIHFQLGFPSGGELIPEKDLEIHHYGRSKRYQKWADSKAFVLLDFGRNTLWWLRKYDTHNRILTVNPRFKSTFLEKHSPVTALAVPPGV